MLSLCSCWICADAARTQWSLNPIRLRVGQGMQGFHTGPAQMTTNVTMDMSPQQQLIWCKCQMNYKDIYLTKCGSIWILTTVQYTWLGEVIILISVCSCLLQHWCSSPYCMHYVQPLLCTVTCIHHIYISYTQITPVTSFNPLTFAFIIIHCVRIRFQVHMMTSTWPVDTYNTQPLCKTLCSRPGLSKWVMLSLKWRHYCLFVRHAWCTSLTISSENRQ